MAFVTNYFHFPHTSCRRIFVSTYDGFFSFLFFAFIIRSDVWWRQFAQIAHVIWIRTCEMDMKINCRFAELKMICWIFIESFYFILVVIIYSISKTAVHQKLPHLLLPGAYLGKYIDTHCLIRTTLTKFIPFELPKKNQILFLCRIKLRIQFHSIWLRLSLTVCQSNHHPKVWEKVIDWRLHRMCEKVKNKTFKS